MSSRFRFSGVCFLVLVMLGGRLAQAQTTLDEALNVPGGTLEFTSSSVQDPSYPWSVVTGPEAMHDGAAAARSGATGYYYSSGTYTRSLLSTTLTEPGVLTFWVKKAGQGQLDLHINGDYRQTIEYSGNAGGEWRFHQVKLPLTEPTTVQWCFENTQQGSESGQTEHYFLLDEVCWHPADERGYVFLLNEDGESYAVAAYFGDATEVNVPAMHAEKPVTVIGANVFADNGNITTVVLPEGLLRIDEGAFSFNANPYRAIVDEFPSSALSSVTLPSTLQYIGANAFCGCQNLKQVTLPAGLTELGESAFERTGLEQIAFPPRLAVIPWAAFQSCLSLRSVVIPASVQKIGAHAFSGCGLTSIVFADRSGADIALGEGCFASNPCLRECILPEGITALPANMLAGDWRNASIDLPAIRIPASVTSVGNQAFDCCNNVTIFFMETPPAVGEAGMTGVPHLLDNAWVVYQDEHQAAWAGALDDEGRFHGYQTESLTGEPLSTPEVVTETDKPTFLDSVVVTFAL
jgi:hypothetical protein